MGADSHLPHPNMANEYHAPHAPPPAPTSPYVDPVDILEHCAEDITAHFEQWLGESSSTACPPHTRNVIETRFIDWLVNLEGELPWTNMVQVRDVWLGGCIEALCSVILQLNDEGLLAHAIAWEVPRFPWQH